MITCLVTDLKEGTLLLGRSLRTHARVLVNITTGLVSILIVAGSLVQGYPTIAMLMNGFAPLIGICAFLIVLALLFSYLISTVEEILTNEDGGVIPEPDLKSSRDHIVNFQSEPLTHCLSLKEHSPPFLFV